MGSEYTDFLEVGFPIIAMIFFVLALAATVFIVGVPNILASGYVQLGQAGFMVLSAFFLLWGPPPMRPLGIHIFLLALAAFFSTHKSAALFVTVFSVVTFFCMIGTAGHFGYTRAIFETTDVQCAGYFGLKVTDTRCDGYLNFLRVLGTVNIFTVASIALNSLYVYYGKVAK